MREITKHTILLLAAVCMAFVSNAQSQVKGSLVDKTDNQPILYCNCVLLNAQDSTFAYGTTSDDKGHFTFKQVADGNYLLRVTYVGYEYYWQSLDVLL